MPIDVLREEYRSESPSDLKMRAEVGARMEASGEFDRWNQVKHEATQETAENIVYLYEKRSTRDLAREEIEKYQKQWANFTESGSTSAGMILTRIMALGLPVELVDPVSDTEKWANQQGIAATEYARNVFGLFQSEDNKKHALKEIEGLRASYSDTGGPGDGSSGMVLTRLLAMGVPENIVFGSGED